MRGTRPSDDQANRSARATSTRPSRSGPRRRQGRRAIARKPRPVEGVQLTRLEVDPEQPAGPRPSEGLAEQRVAAVRHLHARGSGSRRASEAKPDAGARHPTRRRALDARRRHPGAAAGAGEVLCATLEVGVCGTDREISEGLFGVAPEGETARARPRAARRWSSATGTASRAATRDRDRAALVPALRSRATKARPTRA